MMWLAVEIWADAPSAVHGKPEKEEQPICGRAVVGPVGLDLVAQLPRAQEVAFLHVWTSGSSPRKNFPMAIRKGASSDQLLCSVIPVIREHEGRTPEVLEGSSGRRPSPWPTPPRGMPSPGHAAQTQPLTFALPKIQ